MPIKFSQQQVIVSCCGDIEVLSFPPCGPDGAAWLTLEEGPPGEPGRPLPEMEPRDLSAMTGVAIGLVDVRSVDTLLEALRLIRGQLVDQDPGDLDLEGAPRQTRDLTVGDLDLRPAVALGGGPRPVAVALDLGPDPRPEEEDEEENGQLTEPAECPVCGQGVTA